MDCLVNVLVSLILFITAFICIFISEVRNGDCIHWYMCEWNIFKNCPMFWIFLKLRKWDESKMSLFTNENVLCQNSITLQNSMSCKNVDFCGWKCQNNNNNIVDVYIHLLKLDNFQLKSCIMRYLLTMFSKK